MVGHLDMISIVFLFAVVAIGFIKKVNIGILAIGASLILGTVGGMTGSEILSGFNAKLFITLVGVSFLFSLAQDNGTIEIVAKKAIALTGNKTYLIPLILFLVSGVLSALGPGNIPVGNLMTIVAVTVAVSMGENPFLFALAAKVAANGFTLSPLAPAGVLMVSLGEQAGFEDFIIKVMWNGIIWATIIFILFCIYFKFWRIKPKGNIKENDILKTEKLNKSQIFTLICILIMVVLVVVFGMNVGLASFLMAAVLSISGVVNDKKALREVPWGTLILICGVGVLMNVVIELGGLDLLSGALLSIMTPKTAAPIMAVTASVLSFFSSTTGVVMPSLIPTLGPIVHTLGTGTAGFVNLSSVVITSSLSSAFSPASTGGALILAAYMTASNSKDKDEEQNRLFGKLLIIAVVCVFINVVLSALGIYSIIA